MDKERDGGLSIDPERRRSKWRREMWKKRGGLLYGC